MVNLKEWVAEIEAAENADVAKDARPIAHVLLGLIVLFFIAFFTWAANAPLDEVTRGQGKIIPSSQTQIVQHLEGGIISEIDVKEGEVVDKGQVLLKIQNKSAEADLAKKHKIYLNFIARAARLQAEVSGAGEVNFPDDVMREAPEVAQNEQRLFEARTNQLEQQESILKDQLVQKKQELRELNAKVQQLNEAYGLAQQEYKLIKPLVEKGISPKIDLIRIEQKLQDTKAQKQSVELAIPRTQSAIQEAERRISEKRSTYRAEAQQELNKAQSDASRVAEEISAGVDRAQRTEVRSPVKGTVNKILINTIGGVVKPGDNLVEIVPLDDTLLVEARIRPADRAQLWPGLPAVVKVSAYDFSIYGGLNATLTDISADTIVDERGESYYRIRLRTEKNNLGKDKPIIPGMTCQVDILTGEKTVLDYILKPIMKARQNALRER